MVSRLHLYAAFEKDNFIQYCVMNCIAKTIGKRDEIGRLLYHIICLFLFAE